MKAWELLEQKGWCQGAAARSSDGDPLEDANDVRACRWCSYGAMDYIYGLGSDECSEAIRKFSMAIGTPWIASWNDDPNRTASDVINAMKRADL